METYMIEQLAALQEHKTLSKVAEVLHISQPAISRSMQKLEDELGVKLFDRTKNRIVLNAIGELAARHALVVLSAQNEMIRAVRDADRRMHTFSYGSIAPAPMWELTPILSQLYMGMTIAADLQDTDDVLVRGLNDDSYQLIVLLHDLRDIDDSGHPIYYSKPFVHEKLSILLPKTHRLAQRKSLKLKDLAGEKLLIHDKIGFWYGVCKRKIPDATYLEQSDLSTLTEIVNASDLPSFVTNLSERLGIAFGDKIAIPLVDEEVNVQFWCICKACKKREFAALFNAVERMQD
ncbi:MAG: LysR family transcriptional regulator [Proteobacteria bacterium]|nr:LysR family transcriptional regulator [Pseudomonadota bacterium]